jgi:hypothetical protein
MKTILLCLLVSLKSFATEGDLWLQVSLRRMAQLSNIELGNVDDVEYMHPQDIHFVYWLMGQLYDTGKEDRVRLADAIYLSGLEMDNILIEQVGFTWDANVQLTFAEKAILKAREIAGGYIIGLYGDESQIQEAMLSTVEEIRRAREHQDVFFDMWTRYDAISKPRIIQNVWRRSFERAIDGLVTADREIRAPILLNNTREPEVVELHPSAPPQSQPVTPGVRTRVNTRRNTPIGTGVHTPRTPYLAGAPSAPHTPRVPIGMLAAAFQSAPNTPQLRPRTPEQRPPTPRLTPRILFLDEVPMPPAVHFLAATFSNGEEEPFHDFFRIEVAAKGNIKRPSGATAQMDRAHDHINAALDKVDDAGRALTNGLDKSVVGSVGREIGRGFESVGTVARSVTHTVTKIVRFRW